MGGTNASAAPKHESYTKLQLHTDPFTTSCCTQVAEKQAALASVEAHLGSTTASAAQNRDQIQKLQLQMTELQDQHMAWQQNMLDGRLQELRAAAAKVENNQALKVSVACCMMIAGTCLACQNAAGT